jgi:hypothetical protein
MVLDVSRWLVNFPLVQYMLNESKGAGCEDCRADESLSVMKAVQRASHIVFPTLLMLPQLYLLVFAPTDNAVAILTPVQCEYIVLMSWQVFFQLPCL